MMRFNRSIYPSYGQQLVFLFRRAGELYDICPMILMALAHRESTFTSCAVGRSGASGMMQVMPATGERFGLDREQLLDPKTSIVFGAMYLRMRLDVFEEDIVKALSAYNQGSRRVLAGTHSTTFADRVIDTYHNIINHLVTWGYIPAPYGETYYKTYGTYGPGCKTYETDYGIYEGVYQYQLDVYKAGEVTYDETYR